MSRRPRAGADGSADALLSVGLTGGIACGKSRVVAGLAEVGLRTVDLDRVAHQLMEPDGSAYEPVVDEFGPGILDAAGRIDRGRLGAIVFADAERRGRLNAIVHPLVREEEGRVRDSAGPHDVVVTDGALLVEAGFHLRFERLVVVHARPAVQLARLMRRDGLDEGSARQRIEAQLSGIEKRRFAHFHVDTSGSLAETDRAAHDLAGQLVELADRPSLRGALPWRRAAGLLAHGPMRGAAGLEPFSLLAELITGDGPDLARLAARVHGGAWHEAGSDSEPGPETLAGAVALWAVARAGADPEFVAGACYTMARVTHAVPRRLSSACLAGLAVAAAADDTGLDLGRLRELASAATRWGGADPESRVIVAVEAAVRERGDVIAARRWADDHGGDASLAAGIAAFRSGTGDSASDVEQIARSLETYAGFER